MASKRTSGTGSSSEDSDSGLSPNDTDSDSFSGSDEHRSKRKPRSSASSRSDSSPEYGNHKESKKSKRACRSIAKSLVIWSVILHLNLERQSQRQSLNTNPCQSTRRTNTRKEIKNYETVKKHHNKSSTYYTVLQKIDENENRDAVLF